MALKLNGSTDGSISLDAPADTSPSGTDVSLTLPTSAGSSGQYLQTDGSGTLSWQTVSVTPDAITEGNTTVECVDTGSDGHITFDTEGSERARFTSAGRFLIGGSTTHRATFDNGSETCHVQLEGATGAASSLALIGNANSTFYEQPRLILAKAQGSGLGNTGAMQNPSVIGEITFQGSDGTEFVEAARIRAVVSSTPGANDMPTDLSFWTTDDGASSPTERMRVDRNGAIGCYHDTYGLSLRTATGSGTTYEMLYVTYGATNVTNGTNSLRIYTNGNVQNANNSYGGFSDIKLKENIVDASSQWDDIKALQVRKYNFKEETGLPTHTQLGVVAQEAELVSPGLVTESPEKGDVQIPVLDEDGNAVLDENGDQVFNTELRDLGTTVKQVNYSVLYMKAVKALQEAMARIEALETANASLEARLTALEGGAS